MAPNNFERKPISDTQKAVLEKLKTRPRRRPDWSDMMKEVESGRKLRHVECNDRSKPILKSETITNMKGQFVYESEKANSSTSHNELLKQIQGGIRLKPTKTNDRSKPVLQGLRKFRKQMTIEEQIQKSESRAQLGQAIEVSFIKFASCFMFNAFLYVWSDLIRIRLKTQLMIWMTLINCVMIYKVRSKCFSKS